MRHTNRSVGHLGENKAADYLINHGYLILARNVRTPYGEIDLIAKRDMVTVFVEVKTRTTNRFGPPEASITPKKREHMIASSQAYLQAHPELDGDWRLDVIAIKVDRDDKVTSLVHFENAIS